MQLKQITAVLATAGVATAGVVQPFPLKNGFPAPSAKALAGIEHEAGGGIPNIAFPTKLTNAAATTFAILALEEIMEVAFFTELLANVTNEVKGFKLPSGAKDYALKTLKRIHAQEQLHFLGANGALAGAKRPTVGPCKYDFPVSDYEEAMAVAEYFTQSNIAIAPLAQQLFADDGGAEKQILIKVVGAIEVQEAEQLGFYRASQNKVAAAAPFLTQGANEFFATSLSKFLVPGSCGKDFPNIAVIPELAILERPIKPQKDQTLTFVVEGTGVSAAANSIVYMTSLSLPLTVPIKIVKKSGKFTTFTAKFPFTTYTGGFAKGLSYVALVKGHNAKYTDPVEVAADAINLAFLDVQ